MNAAGQLMLSLPVRHAAMSRFHPFVFFLALVFGSQAAWMIRHRSLDDAFIRVTGASMIGLGLGLITLVVIGRACRGRAPCVEKSADLFSYGWIFLPAALLDPFYPLTGALAFLLIRLYRSTAGAGAVTRQWLDGLCHPGASGAETATPRVQFALLLTAVSVIVLRAPELFLEPRFWAEDGAHVFAYVYTHDWWSALVLSEEYYLLLSNLACLLASGLVSLENSPLILTAFALAVKLAAIAIVIYGRAPLWRSPLRKLIFVCIIIFAPSSEEIWLNVNGSQYYLALITALIVCESGREAADWQRYSHRALLLLAGLTGVLSSLLAPVYWLKWWRTRHRDVLVLALILTATTAVQAISILLSPSSTGRADLPTVPMVALILTVKMFLLSLDLDTAVWFSRLAEQARDQMNATEFRMFGYFHLSILALVVAGLAYRLRHGDGLYLLVCSVALGLFCTVFGIAGFENRAFLDAYVGNRYFAVPNMLLLMAAVAAVCPPLSASAPPRLSHLALALLFSTLVLANGAQRFYEARVSSPAWPDWRQEVALWRADPERPLHIWPPPWIIELPASR